MSLFSIILSFLMFFMRYHVLWRWAAATCKEAAKDENDYDYQYDGNQSITLATFLKISISYL